jgi:excisionase family DNA binding protein
MTAQPDTTAGPPARRARYAAPRGSALNAVTTATPASPADRLLTPGEVAAMLRVDPKTVTRWAQAGKLSCMRTPGGHRRYSETEVRSFLNGWSSARAPGPG